MPECTIITRLTVLFSSMSTGTSSRERQQRPHPVLRPEQPQVRVQPATTIGPTYVASYTLPTGQSPIGRQ